MVLIVNIDIDYLDIIGTSFDVTKMELCVLPALEINKNQTRIYTCTSNNQYGPGCWKNPFSQIDYFVIANTKISNQ